MGKHRPKAAPQKVDTEGGSYIGLPSALFESAAWLHGADFRMQAIVLAVARHWNGYNNGQIGVSARQIADAIGSANHNANATALQRAVDRGLLVCTAAYPKAMRKAREYRLPWVTTGKAPQFAKAEHDYRQWSPDDEKGKKPSKSFILPVATTATVALRSPQQGKEETVATTATRKAEIDPSPVATTATPIVIPSPYLSRLEAGNTGGALERPKSMTEDRWILAQRRADAEPSTPDVATVRTLARAYLDEVADRGARSKLASCAGIPASTFSKFLNHEGPLKPIHRGNLVRAIIRTGFSVLLADTGASPAADPQPSATVSVSAQSTMPAANDDDLTALRVRTALDQHRNTKGLGSLRSLAIAAGADPLRVIAFIERRDLLSAPMIARLNREIVRSVEGGRA